MVENQNDKANSVEEFLVGIEDRFELKDTEDVVAVGKVRGTVNVGDAVYISNVGDDDTPIMLTIIKGIEIGPNASVAQATDCQVGLLLKDAKSFPIKPGTVVHTKSISVKDVHQAYMSVLGDVYISQKDMELDDKDFDKMSIADCQELWGMYFWYKQKVKPAESNEERAACQKKIELIAGKLRDKIFAADNVYAVYNNNTNEPHMFSRTAVNAGGGYKCTPPTIMIIPKAYVDMMKEKFPEDKYSIRAIENGENKEGIKNFFGQSFYLNGACGVAVINEQTAMGSDMLVEKPDFEGMNEVNVPVTNPELMRWILLLSQIGKPEGNDSEVIYNVYYNFLSRELLKAKLLVPMKKKGDVPPADDNGKTILKEDIQISFPTFEGKYGRNAVRMYTDWKQLKFGMGDDWDGLIQTIDGMIEKFDCAINVSDKTNMAIYVGEEMYKSIKK